MNTTTRTTTPEQFGTGAQHDTLAEPHGFDVGPGTAQQPTAVLSDTAGAQPTAVLPGTVEDQPTAVLSDAADAQPTVTLEDTAVRDAAPTAATTPLPPHDAVPPRTALPVAGSPAAAGTAPAGTPYPAAARTAHAGTERYRNFSLASFILGVVSVAAGWTLIAPIVGLVLGLIALRKGDGVDRSLTIWGVVLNGIMVAVFGLFVIAMIALFMFSIAAVPFAAI